MDKLLFPDSVYLCSPIDGTRYEVHLSGPWGLARRCLPGNHPSVHVGEALMLVRPGWIAWSLPVLGGQALR